MARKNQPAKPAGPPTEADGPELLSRGRYSLYGTPDQGLHLVYRADGTDDDMHIPIPAALLKLAGAAAGGRGPLAMLRAFMPGMPQ
jgi:hypothetical protein